MIPVYGFRQGDTLGLLILARAEDTVAQLAAKLQSAAAVRVAPLERPRVFYKGQELAPDSTVGDAQMQPLERFDVVGQP